MTCSRLTVRLAAVAAVWVLFGGTASAQQVVRTVNNVSSAPATPGVVNAEGVPNAGRPWTPKNVIFELGDYVIGPDGVQKFQARLNTKQTVTADANGKYKYRYTGVAAGNVVVRAIATFTRPGAADGTSAHADNIVTVK